MNNYADMDIGDEYLDMIPFCPNCEQQFTCPMRNYYRLEFDGMQRQNQGPPKSPPPSITPEIEDLEDINMMAVDPGAIAPCIYRFSYIWLRNGKSFWAYLIYVGRKSASGWRYTGRRWVYFGIDLKQIRNFICY